MKRLNARERKIVTGLAVALGLFMLDRFAWTPVAGAWQQLDADVARQEAQLRHDKQLFAERVRIRRDYAVLAGSRFGNEESGRAGGMTGFLRDLELLAHRSGLKITDMKPQSSENRTARQDSVSVSIEAGWEPLMRFMFEVSRSSRRWQLAEASLHLKGQDDARLIGQFVISAGS